METIDDSLAKEAAEWFGARWRTQNWLAIAPGEEIPPFISGWSRTLAHMFQIAFTPEIERRIAAGALGEGFFLRFAQLLQPPSGQKVVRLNEEVRGIMKLRRNTPLPEDAALTDADLRQVQLFDLIEEELDSGHFTIWFTSEGWSSAFDLRSGRAKALQFSARAREFLAAARFSVAQGHAGAATDSLFSACELLSKARLMLHHNPAAKSKTHGAIGSAINAWGRLGNVQPDFVALFNRLAAARSRARYEARPDITAPTMSELQLVESVAAQLERGVSPRVT
jgi:hypothetical protein